MRITASQDKIERTHTPVVILLTQEQTKELKEKKSKTVAEEFLAPALETDSFTGESDQVFSAYTHKKLPSPVVLFVGVGKEEELSAEKVRRAASTVVNVAKAMKLNHLAVNSEIRGLKKEETVRSLCEGLLLANYVFDKYKTEDKEKKTTIIDAILLMKSTEYMKEVIAEAQIVCNATNFVRDLQNGNADEVTTLYLESVAKALAKKNKLKITVLDEKQMEKKGLNLIRAVGAGSRYPPRLIFIEYSGNKKSKETLAVIGKGITFDSGGLNLKPTRYIETMKSDMSGAAVVLGIVKAVSDLHMPVNIIGVVPTCENAIGKTAYKPGDVYKGYNGKTVEIGNTDAEGRLILADALAYTEKNFKPSTMIDFATLTGAIVVALGEYTAGMMGTNKDMIKNLFNAGQTTYERVWEMPMYEEYMKEMKSDIADTSNIGSGRYAGSITAACFLQKFVDKTPWVHLDIAGTAFWEKPRYYNKKGGTGFGVRLIVEYLKKSK